MSNKIIYSESGYGRNILNNLADSGRYYRYLAGKINPFLGEVNLELGAGTGGVTAHIPPRKNLILVELSRDNVAVLTEKFNTHPNIQVVHQDIQSLPDELMKQLDAIYSSNVLEHIEDDSGLIRDTLARMKPGARFVAIVPAMRFLYSEVDRQLHHFRRYKKKDIRRVARGLPQAKLTHLAYFNPVGALGWWVKYKLMKSHTISENDSKLMDTLIPFIKWTDLLPLPFGQSLIFTFEKTNPS
ncbi:MAG: class I SAM-dependent methyltransferase [Deltaproteobacteria bacterium]|nr:class I SAM-dependent methyltransferase [Deltaproteobacteria bacterium]